MNICVVNQNDWVVSGATPGQQRYSASSRNFYWLNATVRGLHPWHFHLLSFTLVVNIVALWPMLRKNEWGVVMIMRNCPLLRKARHRAMITPVRPLSTRLIHISPSYCKIFRLFEIILELGLSVGLELKFNVLCKSIGSKKLWIWYKLYLKICLIANGSSGSNGWARVKR